MWLSQIQLAVQSIFKETRRMTLYQLDNHAVGISAWKLFPLNFSYVAAVSLL